MYILLLGIRIIEQKLQNNQNNRDSNGTSAHIQNYSGWKGSREGKGIISNKDPLNKYYAYGI